MKPTPATPIPSARETVRLLRRLLVYVRPYRLVMGVILVLTVVVGVGANYPPVLIRNAVDHWIGNAGLAPTYGPETVTLYEVGTVKPVRVSDALERLYVSVDGGMSDNARPALYGAQYSARIASRTSDAAPALARVVGRHCESGDIVVGNTVTFTPKGFDVMLRQRSTSAASAAGEGWVSAVSKPSPPALETADASSATPTDCMPPCTIGCSIPSMSVAAVFIAERLPDTLWVQTVFFIVAGLGWGVPILPLISWMNRGS